MIVTTFGGSIATLVCDGCGSAWEVAAPDAYSAPFRDPDTLCRQCRNPAQPVCHAIPAEEWEMLDGEESEWGEE